MASAQPLSRNAKAAFLAVLLVPLTVVLVRANSDTDVTVDADVSVLDDGRTVRSDFSTNSCGEPLRLEVEETRQAVRVRTIVRRDEGPFVSCDDFARGQTLETTLDEPLGNRTLVVVKPRSTHS